MEFSQSLIQGRHCEGLKTEKKNGLLFSPGNVQSDHVMIFEREIKGKNQQLTADRKYFV